MEKHLIYNAIRTPDGTILESRHVHDYVTHLDANGDEYMVDGGFDYLRRNVNKVPAEDLSLYSDEKHEVIREHITRGGRGLDGKQPLKYVLLKDISSDWLNAIIKYEKELRPDNRFIKHYIDERKYRKTNK